MRDVTNDWIEDVPHKGASYWDRVRHIAGLLKSDGCTGVKDYFLDACLEHDIHWRTRLTIDGHRISISESNRRFRLVIQNRSRFGVLSPLSWWRWVGVSVFGRITGRN